MAENDTDDRERTESPSQKRLDDARQRGQVPRSRDLGAAVVVLTGGLGLYGLGGGVGAQLLSIMRDGLTLGHAQAADSGQMLLRLQHAAVQGFLAAAPLLGLLLAAAVLAPLAIGGWNFSGQALTPDFSRLDPISGLKRMFSTRGLIELGKALARFVVVAAVTVVLLMKQFHRYAGLGIEPTRVGVIHALLLTGEALIALGGALAVIALVDVPLAIWQYYKGLRMTRQEVRDEHKETEGSPETRSRVRRVQQQLARRRMMQQVPKADVVVTNPTHYAVALRYDERRNRAPVVVAKGVELIALAIRRIAEEHAVPIVEAPPLARALHGSCEIGDEIPTRLYAAVAKVLTYVYQLRSARRYAAVVPQPPRIDLPGE
ncbi:MAG TPA: flagellar biosynthesis protein FlhB [Steroidobacteraceae bacterium]|jgi:flagellar biosynthetic protein FlhB|nr:flagellar biosynthesis protein FlhB [Steroidobacteraceae bacterium]